MSHDARRLSESQAHQILARAVELDSQHAAEFSMDDLRVAAIEAGIHPDAFDRAAAEVATAPGVAEARRHDAPSRWAPIVANLKAVLAFWVVLTILTRLGHLLPDEWTVSAIRNILACGIGVWMAIRLRAAMVRVALTGTTSALMALFAVHTAFGIQSAQGGPTQFAVLIAGLLGAGAAVLLSPSVAGSAHGTASPALPSADAPTVHPVDHSRSQGARFRPLKLVRLGPA